MAAPWAVQLRDERGVAHKLELPDAGATTARQLKRLVNSVRALAPSRPRTLASARVRRRRPAASRLARPPSPHLAR